MDSENNSLGINDGSFVVFVDELDGDLCSNIQEANRLLYYAFANGAMRVVVKRLMPDLPRLNPKKESGVAFISPE